MERFYWSFASPSGTIGWERWARQVSNGLRSYQRSVKRRFELNPSGKINLSVPDFASLCSDLGYILLRLRARFCLNFLVIIAQKYCHKPNPLFHRISPFASIDVLDRESFLMVWLGLTFICLLVLFGQVVIEIESFITSQPHVSSFMLAGFTLAFVGMFEIHSSLFLSESQNELW